MEKFTFILNGKHESVVIDRVWNKYDMMRLCSDHDYYDAGDVNEYNNLLEFVRLNEPTRQNIFIAALDIMLHTDFDDSDKDKELLCCIMDEITRYVVKKYIVRNL